MTADGSRPKLLKIRQLNGVAKVWFHFIINNILPTTHTSEVQLSKAALIYTIMNGGTVDLPSILADGIYDFAHQKGQKALGHGSLIQTLCHRAGVEFPTEPKLVEVCPTINASFINDSLGIIPPPPPPASPAPPGPSAPPAAPARRARQPDISTIWEAVQSMQRRARYSQSRQMAFQDYMSAQIVELFRQRDIQALPFEYPAYVGSDEEAPGTTTADDPTAADTETAAAEDDADHIDDAIAAEATVGDDQEDAGGDDTPTTDEEEG